VRAERREICTRSLHSGLGTRYSVLLLLLVALPGTASYARSRRSHTEGWARDHFAAAERMREALNGRPPADRSRRDYQRVLDAYRNVYYGAPASSKADPSVVAVAETLVEMGRRFNDDKILNSAIGQYKFLRREYPGSKYRCDALFTIGEIYKDDLNDPQQARAVFEEFLRRYPHNRLVEDAQQAVAELERQAAAEKKAEAGKKSGAQSRAARAAGDKNAADKGGTAKIQGSKDATPKEAEIVGSAATESPGHHGSHLPRVTGIRHWSTPDYTRVAIDLENDVKFSSQRIADPDRIFFDLRETKLASTLVGKSFDVDDGFLKKIRVAQFQPGRTRVVLEVDNLSDYDAFLLPNPYRLIVDIHGKDAKTARVKPPKDATMVDVEAPPQARSKADADPAESAENQHTDSSKVPVTTEDVGDSEKIEPEGGSSAAISTGSGGPKATSVDAKRETPAVTKVVVEADDDDVSTRNKRGQVSTSHAKSARAIEHTSDAEMREARPTATGDRSLIRALGLKIGRIVIDPGHGGHDTGTIGPNGLEEKDLVLEVGRRLGKLLETRLGAEVVYTRKDDTFIPLETRTAVANQQRADLFISIHANSSRDPAARGVETYYLNFTSSPEALEVAARENAVSEKSIYELQDLVKKIALKEKIEESREFAGDVQESLHSGLAAKSPGIRNRGVKKAPFIVLIGANMPSILAEISFVSNPGDEHRLETGDYRQRIAESLYRGIAKYVNGLSGVKVASKMDKAAGQ